MLSHFPPLLSTMTDASPWPVDMSIGLFFIARTVEIGDKPADWDTLVSNHDALVILGKSLHRRGWKLKTPNQVRAELLRIKARWDKLTFKSEARMMERANAPWSWIEDSEDEDDIFMPPPVGSKARAEWDKRQEKKKSQAKKSKCEGSSKGKGEASSKGKGKASC